MIREKNKRSGVSYALTNDGIELPVIDVTHPAFACKATQTELNAIAEATLQQLQRSARVPRFLLQLLARRSMIMRGSMAAGGSFMSGMTTYLCKINPENLGRYAGRIDRQLAASLSPVCVRVRLSSSARLLADGLAPPLAARGDPLWLLNVAGGTAIDSLNALMILRKEQPQLLAGRCIRIKVLDPDQAAPAFGARALAALTAPAAPLHGIEVTFEHVAYDWNDATDLLRQIDRPQAVVALSSEGGLFEYGSDAAIDANLRTLCDHSPDDSVIVGSYLKDERAPRSIKEISKMRVRLFDQQTFDAAVGRAGWRVECALDGNPMYRVVSLRKALRPSP
jgi:hypothetical protein